MKFAWIRPNGTWNDRKEAIVDSLESGFDHIMDLDNAETIKKLGSVTIISDKEDSDITLLGLNNKITMADIKKAQESGKEVAAYVEINNKDDELLVSKLGTVADYVILKGKNWKVIPLENIIASLQNRTSKIIVDVPNYEEAKLALETMEHGSDGVLLSSNDGNEIRKLGALIEKVSFSAFGGSSRYPYPFLDTDLYGKNKVALIIAFITAAFLALGYLSFVIDRLLGKNGKKLK